VYHEYLGQNESVIGERARGSLALFCVNVVLLLLMWESAIYENVSGVVVHCIDVFIHRIYIPFTHFIYFPLYLFIYNPVMCTLNEY